MIEFNIPQNLNATTPPERRGIRRDRVKLMVLDKKTGKTSHDQFNNLKEYLKPGDLIVLNLSRTVPAVLYAQLIREGSQHTVNGIEVRLAHRLNGSCWQALVVNQSIKTGDHLIFSNTLSAEIIDYSHSSPFAKLKFNKEGSSLYNDIYSMGEPVRYEYIKNDWPLDYYQTVFSSQPGSVEMPSAGRAFSWELLFELKNYGVRIATIVLHTGLTYLPDSQSHQNPKENKEAFYIPSDSIDMIQSALRNSNRIIAVGTTVVRTLETAFNKDGESVLQKGWTNLYIHQNYSLKIVNGLITGFHEPEASHLDLLTAFIQPHYLQRAYHEALHHNYLWHEFGDSHLII